MPEPKGTGTSPERLASLERELKETLPDLGNQKELKGLSDMSDVLGISVVPAEPPKEVKTKKDGVARYDLIFQAHEVPDYKW